MFHTQEKREKRLTTPIKCCDKMAWLGEGFYFWYEESDAHYWGSDKKYRTGRYEIYRAEVDRENVMDTVFNEKHYQFWKKQIEKVAKSFSKKTGMKPSLKEINEYFRERATWDKVDGILFQDLPTSQQHSLVERFFYRKRIQLVAFNLKIVSNFTLYGTYDCVSK